MHTTISNSARTQAYIDKEENFGAHNYHPIPVVIDSAEGVYMWDVDDMPTDFEKSEEIVLTGSMKENTFYADEMLVKCPSKYMENEIQK